MIRLPVPGSDEGKWGELLNDFLRIIHSEDGDLKNGVVSESKLTQEVKDKLNATLANDGADGREIELRSDGGHIQWRYVGDSWVNLINLDSLKGDEGQQGPKGDPGATTIEGVDGLQLALDSKQSVGNYLTNVNIENLPAGSVVSTFTTTRPTSRTDILVIFRGEDPSTNALEGDEWWPAA